ncbi:MAG: 16S rRNA (cytidine(1402)-2'-O)-methyltransferase [Patescibacteria group bacterium]
MARTLYIIATPIGNLEDITLRALGILKEVDLILVEDTRVTKKLLMHYDIDKHTLSYHQHSTEKKKLEILRRLVKGENIALASDAGTPGISDPGNELIDYLLNKEPTIRIVPVPGPAAITSALSVSGFKVSKFLFLGFLPKKKRKKLFGWIKKGKIAFAFYESPKRILKTLDFLEEQLGEDRRILIARELTKLHETLYRGKLSEVRAQLEKKKVRGEIVVVVEEK